MNKEKLLKKIKKCLALSKSNNEHEAAAALRQARALMDAHDIEEADISALDVSEAKTNPTKQKKSPLWEAMLVNTIKIAFGCSAIREINQVAGGVYSRTVFIGLGPSAQVAQYAMDVLYRKIKFARATFIRSLSGRLKASTKTRRADLFCEGWVSAVATVVRAFVGEAETVPQAVTDYMERNYSSLDEQKVINRSKNKGLKEGDYKAYIEGRKAGKEVELMRGMDGKSPPPALEGKA